MRTNDFSKRHVTDRKRLRRKWNEFLLDFSVRHKCVPSLSLWFHRGFWRDRRAFGFLRFFFLPNNWEKIYGKWWREIAATQYRPYRRRNGRLRRAQETAGWRWYIVRPGASEVENASLRTFNPGGRLWCWLRVRRAVRFRLTAPKAAIGRWHPLRRSLVELISAAGVAGLVLGQL